MEELKKHLRSLFLILFLSPLALFGIIYLIFHNSAPALTDVMSQYYVMIILLGVTFFGVAASSLYLRHANRHISDMADDASEEEKISVFRKAYTVRIATLAALETISAICYALTHDDNAIYLVFILALLIALSYPSDAFIHYDRKK